MAPVHVYFRPAEVKKTMTTTTTTSSKKRRVGDGNGDGDGDGATTTETTTFLAAQFRGRGLMARSPPLALPPGVAGTVLSVPEHGPLSSRRTRRKEGGVGGGREGEEEEDEGKIEVNWEGGTFRSVVEWSHEHDPRILLAGGGGGGGKGGGGGVGPTEAALDWMEVARAAHDPLPPPTL